MKKKPETTVAKTKKKYKKPALRTEPILEAGLGTTCNTGQTGVGGRKTAYPCSKLKS